jgi:hypothetical protein
VTNTNIQYLTPGDALRAAKDTAKRLLSGRTADTEALLDFDPADYAHGKHVDADAIDAWVVANSKPGRAHDRRRTRRVEGTPITLEESTND